MTTKASANDKETVANAGPDKTVATEAPLKAAAPVGDASAPTSASNEPAACVICGSDRDLVTTDGKSADPLTFCALHRPANLK